ncbi:hypothetical protein B0H10DRAFT_1949380 [Mycena sp. CBHHK59/15]|nr:hypothetical protein B0H10DRAFT_1949380 [Mycena sp. CBHHK59/15]
MDVDEYNSIKAMGDADHAHAILNIPRQATAKISRTDTTADIKTIFTRHKGRKNPKTGLLEDGALCQVCEKDGVESSACFLTGSVTSLRNHIARREEYFKVYKARCEKLGITMNERAIPKSSDARGIQGSLDGIVVYEPRVPPFTPAGVRDYIIEMIVTQDEVFR